MGNFSSSTVRWPRTRLRPGTVSYWRISRPSTGARAIFLTSGSVALLASTIHNFSHALIAVPPWAAFILSRRVATRHYAYGFGRAEDLAGLFIVAVVALSAIVVAWESNN